MPLREDVPGGEGCRFSLCVAYFALVPQDQNAYECKKSKESGMKNSSIFLFLRHVGWRFMFVANQDVRFL
jgi:hypothetical protein